MSKGEAKEHFAHTLSQYLMFNFLGGPKLLPARIFINMQKGGTLFFVLFLMIYYQNFSTGMYLYLALHGSYGLLWLGKDMAFPDKGFNQRQTIGSLLLLIVVLVMYWYPAYLMGIGEGIQNPTNARLITAIVTYVFGSQLMMLADCQKYFVLRHKKGLVSDGLFAYTRNPNYLGEVMIYGSFGIVTGDWRSYAIYSLIWLSLFLTNMIAKDHSLAKKEGWEKYKRRSSMFLPRVLSNNILNYGFYVCLIAFFVYDYSQGGLIGKLKAS